MKPMESRPSNRFHDSMFSWITGRAKRKLNNCIYRVISPFFFLLGFSRSIYLWRRRCKQGAGWWWLPPFWDYVLLAPLHFYSCWNSTSSIGNDARCRRHSHTTSRIFPYLSNIDLSPLHLVLSVSGWFLFPPFISMRYPGCWLVELIARKKKGTGPESNEYLIFRWI
jgi:hypothetical protein